MRLTTEADEVRSFDVPGEERGWHTALYYFAEHVRSLSRGRVNHKVLYSYVGTNGHYINHDNPTIRKRTAAVLSRLIHSRRYVEDFRTSFEKNNRVFDEAARLLCADLCGDAECEAEKTVAYFCGPLWHDVERGLEHEREDGRRELNLNRIENEMQSLFRWCDARSSQQGQELLETIVSSYFQMMTFGHLDEQFIFELADETPLVFPEPSSMTGARMEVREDCACLIKYADAAPEAISGRWTIEADRPFSIGRYTDCSLIETNGGVSRRHCRIVNRDGRWYLEDQGSRHGSVVLRDGDTVYDSACDGIESFELAFGDRIVLAGFSRYWFGALLDEGRPAED